MKKIFACVVILLCNTPSAFGWDLSLNDSQYLPSSMIVVDKGAKELFHMEKRSPLAIRHKFPSIHGEVDGDKKFSGDLKTPEGVYFITGKVSYPLDFLEYGSEAHALNYPNPVDRLKGKTGYGIWIHSKGEPIENRFTRGCVAIDLASLATLGPYLAPGMPVLLAQNIINDTNSLALPKGSKKIETSRLDALLVEKSVAWNKAWAAKSTAFFDFYDAESYTKAQRKSFAVFKQEKEHIFENISWIYTSHDDIRVLYGPDYAVTWFKQYYRAPNLVSEGIRRLYWQKNAKGEYVIVGMEWRQGNYGLHNEFQQKAEKEALELLNAWKKAWEESDIDAYSAYYTKNARQDRRKGRERIASQKEQLWELRKPQKIEFQDIKIKVKSDGVHIELIQIYEDFSGYGDKGRKRIVLHPDADKWYISNETWTSMS